MNCQYCSGKVRLVTGDIIYPHRMDLNEKTFFQCQNCKAYVGCHPGTTKPLGTLANKETREARSLAHAAFDSIWKSGEMTRSAAYTILADMLEIDKINCHIGKFDTKMCKKVVEVCFVFKH